MPTANVQPLLKIDSSPLYNRLLTPLLIRHCPPWRWHVTWRRHETWCDRNTRLRRAGNGRLQQIVSSSPVYKPIVSACFHVIYSTRRGTNCQPFFQRLCLKHHKMSSGGIIVAHHRCTSRDDWYKTHTALSGIMKTNVFFPLKDAVVSHRRYSWFHADGSVIHSASTPDFTQIAPWYSMI